PAAAPAPEPVEPAAAAHRGRSFAVPVAVAYGVLALLQGAAYAAGLGQITRQAFDPRAIEVANAFDADALPPAIGNWRRDPKAGFTPRDKPEMYYAKHSRSWVYN